MSQQRQRPPRRILYMLTCLEEEDWGEILEKKWEQIERMDTAVDVWLIGFGNAEAENSGTWQTVLNQRTGKKEFVRTSNICAFDALAFAAFVQRNYQPGNTHLVIGTHGQGGYFWLNGITEDGGKTYLKGEAYNVNRFVGWIKQYQFLSVLLDCCMMGELYTAKAFGRISPLLAGAEGFMWSADKALGASMFNPCMIRNLSSPTCGNTYDALITGGTTYVMGSPHGRADFSIYNTASAKALLDYILSNPKYTQLMTKQLDNCWKEPPQFSPQNFYTVRGDPDTFDAMYLLDLGKLLENDPMGLNILDSVQWWQRGPVAGEAETKYNFPLSGMSITVAHMHRDDTPADPETPTHVADTTSVVALSTAPAQLPAAATAATPLRGSRSAAEEATPVHEHQRQIMQEDAEQYTESDEEEPQREISTHNQQHMDPMASAGGDDGDCNQFTPKPGARGPSAKYCVNCRTHIDLHA